MSELDGPALRQRFDPDGAYERNLTLPQQCRQAWDAVKTFSLPDAYRNADRVIVAGMGGSAIAGDFLQALCFRDSETPVTVVRGYDLPKFVNQDTLVVACSHSGNTEETLSVFQQARQRKAKVAVVTTGGALKDAAQKHGLPLLAYDFYPEPRSAFGHSFLRLLAIARAAGALEVTDAAVENAISEIEGLQDEMAETATESDNPAKSLARRLHNRLAMLIGGEFLGPVARRMKTQINENADCWAIWDELPELHHNMMVGLKLPSQVAGKVHALIFEHKDLHPRVLLRCQITTELFDRANLSYERYDIGGADALAAMLRGVYLGGMVSFYLALLYGIQPSEIDPINYLKDRLAAVE